MEDKDLISYLILITIVVFIIWRIIQNGVQFAKISNEETWEVIRDKQERVINIIVHRNVKSNG